MLSKEETVPCVGQRMAGPRPTNPASSNVYVADEAVRSKQQQKSRPWCLENISRSSSHFSFETNTETK